MNENSEQTAIHEVLQSSELTARLLRRANISPGVLDTTMLRQVLARLAEWVEPPASLYDELMAQYRIDDDSLDVDDPLVMEQSWMANINAYLTNSSSFSSTINQFISGAAASQAGAVTGAGPSSRFEKSGESHSNLVTSRTVSAGLPRPSTFSSAAPSSSSSARIPNPDAQTTLPGEAGTLSPAMKFRVSRSPARRAWDAAPADASDVARSPVLKSVKSEEDRPTHVSPGNIEHTRVMKSERPRANAPAVTPLDDLPLARTQIDRPDIQRKLANEGGSGSQQLSNADAPARPAGASPGRGPANPARETKQTGGVSNENLKLTGDEPGIDGRLQSDTTSHPVSAQAKTLSASSHKTLPLVQRQINSSQTRRESPDFVWRKGADPSAVTNPTASATGSKPVQAVNQAAGHTSTAQSPNSQIIMSEAASRKDESRAGAGVTTERILRNISRKLLIERERRGY
jgi:hypothetical protein